MLKKKRKSEIHLTANILHKQQQQQNIHKRLQKEMLSNRTNMQFVGTDALNSAKDKQLNFNDSEKVK